MMNRTTQLESEVQRLREQQAAQAAYIASQAAFNAAQTAYAAEVQAIQQAQQQQLFQYREYEWRWLLTSEFNNPRKQVFK